MLSLFLTSIREALLEGIKTELQRIDRDVTENDGLEFFSYPERDDDFATHITTEGKIMAGEDEADSEMTLDTLDTDTLETLYRELKALDDDQNGTMSIGRAVLQKLNLKGCNIVDVTLVPVTEWIDLPEQDERVPVQTFEIYLGTDTGNTFKITVTEITEE